MILSMTDAAARVLHDAMTLDDGDRAELAAALLASLDEEDDANAQAAWAIEIRRRAARARAGDTSASDWRDVLQRIRARS
jgi:putative addiction module component (TIGR02574 family)